MFNPNYIMVSGHNQKHLSKITSLNGTIMLNLEDGVPRHLKKSALENIIQLLQTKPNKDIVVRVNAIDDGGLDEIAALNEFDISFRIPKIRLVEQLDEVCKLTDKELHLSIETKEAFFHLQQFKHPQIRAFYLGILDLFDELRLSHELITFDNPLVLHILVEFVLKSLYLDVVPIGFVYQQYKDLDGFRRWCDIQRQVGIRGVGCITPAQLEIANKIFIQSDKKYAKMIVDRFEKEGPFTIDGLYVDEPIYKNYLLHLTPSSTSGNTDF